MKPSVMERATILGEYIKKNGATVRHTPQEFLIYPNQPYIKT